MFVISDILSDSNNQLSENIFVMPEILSGAWKKNILSLVWSNVFWYVKVCIFWKCIQYTIHCDTMQMLRKFPPDKINCTKDVLFFILRAPNHHIFTFNLWFLFKLNHKVCLPKTVCGIFQFRFCLVFIKVYIFVQQNAWTLNSG